MIDIQIVQDDEMVNLTASMIGSDNKQIRDIQLKISRNGIIINDEKLPQSTNDGNNRSNNEVFKKSKL